MAERIWSSPRLFARLHGDQEAARAMERRALACVGYLFDQLRPGQTYRVQSWNYNDGSRIKAHVWRDVLGERARVEVFAPALGAGTITIGPLWSGLAYPAWEDWYGVDELTGLDLRQPTFWAGKTREGAWSFSSFTPNGVRIARAPDSAKPERLHPALAQARPGKVPYQNIEQYDNTNLPGSFTGKMRAVVQRMLGAGQVCKWRSRWENCHWIFTASDGRDWVIHFSEASGLRASLLTYINVMEEAVAGAVANDPDSVTWLTLIAPVDVADYFDTLPISHDIGFACNTNGSEARNISVSVDIDGYRYAHEWVISIASVFDDGEYVPGGASLTLASRSLAWMNTRGRMRFPNGASLSQIIEWGAVDDANDPPKPPGGNLFKWPFYVYFDGDEIQRFYANFEYRDFSTYIAPDPVGYTDADVWKASGQDYFPYVSSFPSSGIGSFSLGATRTDYSRFYFSGPGTVPEPGEHYSFYEVGEQEFSLEQVDDASDSLVSFGSGVAPGGPVYAAVRTRKTYTNGGGLSNFYAAWVPNGDRESILFLHKQVSSQQPYQLTKSIRYGHMFFSGGIECVGGDENSCCGEGGVIIQKIDGVGFSKTTLPATADLAVKYSGSWHAPNGTCPYPHYQKPYLCGDQISGQIYHTGSYDLDLGAFDAPPAKITVNVYLNASGGVADNVYTFSTDDGNDSTASDVWLATGLSSTDFPYLYVNRTYKGNGMFQPMPTTLEIQKLGDTDPAYIDLFKLKGGPCLWVGEPET